MLSSRSTHQRDLEQVVLILVGLIASGKSTFAQALEQHLPDKFRRCNQDDLGGQRKRVEQLARASLREGLSICIDRTNFDAVQRSHWIRIAREFPRASVRVIVFDTPHEVCAARLQTRISHPTITTPEQGLVVLSRLVKDFQRPSPHEGYDRMLTLKPSDHSSPQYTLRDVLSILERLENSKVLHSSFSTPSDPSRGNSFFRGNRGNRNSSAPRGMPRSRSGISPYQNSGPRGRGRGNLSIVD